MWVRRLWDVDSEVLHPPDSMFEPGESAEAAVAREFGPPDAPEGDTRERLWTLADRVFSRALITDLVLIAAGASIGAFNAVAVRRYMLRDRTMPGDNEATAKIIGAAVGVTEVHARLLPEDKLAWIREAQARGRPRPGGAGAAGRQIGRAAWRERV